MIKSNYTEVNREEIEHYFNGDLILLVTATDLETTETHKKIKPFSDYDKIVKVYDGALTYYFGMLGNFRIAHVQSSMGSLARDSSMMTISTAVDRIKTKIVIMVGIAFGVDEIKQNIGDVLISESVIPYNTKRVGKNVNINRGIEVQSSKILLNRFKNVRTTWEFYLSAGVKAKLIPTRLLSGEELIDNLEFRNKLIAEFPDSKGGEMEGIGVSSACDGKADWIVVKGICDFANGEKATDKELRQTTAIDAALSVCVEIFNSSTVFNDLKVSSESFDDIKMLKSDLNISEVLFDIYDPSKEKYYVERKVDESFNQTIKQLGIWVHGPTGCGKTNLIIRNLLKNKKDFIQVSLAACVDIDIDSFFREILYEVAAKIEGTNYHIQATGFTEYSRELVSLLKKHYKNKELILFIEEIPISSDKSYEEFTGKIFSLLISKNFEVGLAKIKFVLSSINNPINYMRIFHQKIHQQLNFMSLKYWNGDDVIVLIGIIENEMEFLLPIGIKDELVKAANGSPRFIKKFFRSVCTLNKKDERTLQFLIAETQRELTQLEDV